MGVIALKGLKGINGMRAVVRQAIGSFVAFAVIGFAPTASNAEIVFGNLGPSGNAAIDSGNVAQMGSTIAGLLGNKFAIAFTTGANASYLKLQSVTLGLGDISPFSTAILNLVNDNASSPTGSTLASDSLQVQSNGLYTFGLGVVSLAANTKYWVTLEAQDAAAPSTFSWLRGDIPASPTGLNGSGYTFPATGGMRSQNGGSWVVNSGADTLSISVTAVPEPPAYALGAFSFAFMACELWRRRKNAI